MPSNRPEVPTGQLKVTPLRADASWLLIEIGRGRYTKRFNLSREEATLLLDELAEVIGRLPA
jgi:hypothetical protein